MKIRPVYPYTKFSAVMSSFLRLGVFPRIRWLDIPCVYRILAYQSDFSLDYFFKNLEMIMDMCSYG
jgi:hypothetical protein